MPCSIEIDAAAHGIQDAERALGVAGAAFVEAMRLADAGLHLLGRIMRILRIDALGHHAAGRHDLHQVGAGMDLLAHRLHHLVDAVGDPAGAVAVAAGHADHAAGAAHGRPQEAAGVDRVADGELDVVLAAAVAHRGDAALERALHKLHAADGDLGGAHAILHRAGIALGAGQRMDVAVDQAGDQGAARGVDPLAGKARELTGRCDALDLAALFQDRHARPAPSRRRTDGRRHTTWP